MKVLIADDQRVVREGLFTIVGNLPGVEVVGLGANGVVAVALTVEHAPDVVLMDLRMPVMDGAEATAVIRSHHPGTQVVVLTTYADDASIITALSAGATGFLTKDATRDDIRRALEGAAVGQGVLDPGVQAALLSAAQAGAAGSAAPAPVEVRPLPDGLTARSAPAALL
ncbi:MAG: response regulator [Acidimicrobiales bacterium]